MRVLLFFFFLILFLHNGKEDIGRLIAETLVALLS